MGMTLRGGVEICLLAGLCGTGYGQNSGSIQGHVLDAGSGQPVKEATVVTIPAAGGRRAETQTDAAGAYRFLDIEAGQYKVSVSKAGYDRNPFLVGRSSYSRVLTLGAGQQLKAVDFSLNRAGVITGSVRGPDDQPVMGAQVSALTALELTGRRWVSPAGVSVRTDDRGQFRLFDLSQGRYYVKVLGPSQPVVFRAGGEVTKAPKTDADFLSTYYPGVDTLSQAVPVAVTPGRETPGIDLRLLTGPLFAVSGRVQRSADADGRTLTTVWLESLDDTNGEAQHVACDSAGQFQFGSVRPGAYRVTAYQMSAVGSVPAMAGAVEISVTDRPRENLVIGLSAASEAGGMLRVEDGKPVPAEVAQRLGVAMMPERQEPGVPRPEPAALRDGG